MAVYIEETLKSGDLPTDLKPHLVWGEVLEGARKPLMFMNAVEETDILINKTGVKISVPLASQLSASTITESNLDTSGYTVADKTITDTDITIGNEVYVATRLSDILKEDQQDIDWVRMHLRNMLAGIYEYVDAAVRDALIAGAGNTVTAGTTGTLAYTDVVAAVRTMKQNHWFPEAGSPPLLFMPPACEGDVVNDTRFYQTARYASAQAPELEGPLNQLFASCRVFVTSGFATPSPSGAPELALVVMPPTHRFGPSTIFAWKRRMTVKTDYQTQYARTIAIASVRYGMAVVQANAIVLISNC